MKIKTLLAFSVVLNFTFLLTTYPLEKILIITHVHNRPDFIKTQLKTLKAFLKDDFEYVVFNDAPYEDMKLEIEETCHHLGVNCIRVPQELHNQRNDPGSRHIHGIQFSLQKIGFDHDGIVFIIDSDMFPIKPFCVHEYFENYDFIGQQQVRPHVGPVEVVYVAPLLIFMNMQTLPNKRTINFDGGYIKGHACDVGGHIYYYFQENPSIKIKFAPVACIAEFSSDPQKMNMLDPITQKYFSVLKQNFDDSDPHRMQLHGDNHFIHYVAGSNWNHRSHDYHKKKTQLLYDYLDEMIANYSNN